MLNRKYYSFERNNYYYGKLLTTKDFQGEQEYLGNKRRFLNRTLHGMGIVYGMDVVVADDSSIVLQSGFALDSSGREIVVPSTQVIKLSTIDGFADLTSENAYLGIVYGEESVDAVYSAMSNTGTVDENKHFNRLKEGYRLFLADEEKCQSVKTKEDNYIQKQVIYQDEDLIITECMPNFLVPETKLKLKITIKKISHAPFILSMGAQVSAQGFITPVSDIKIDNLSLEYGEETVLAHELLPENYVFGGNDLEVILRNIVIQKADRKESIKTEYKMELTPVKDNLLSYVMKRSYTGVMDVELDRQYDEKLWLAKIHFLKSGSTLLIDAIEMAPLDQYVYNNEQLMILQKLNDYLLPNQFGKVESGIVNTIRTPQVSSGDKNALIRTQSSGVFEMAMGNGGEVGKSYFSDEIMHGLGNGSVYVEVGIEYITKDSSTKQDKEEIILGDNGIFQTIDSSMEERLYLVDSAVKILPDRGTFIVGIRPKAKTGKIGLRIRWYAFKTEDLQQRVVKKEQAGCIMIQPDTIVLPPKGMIHINAVFINMPEEALSFTLLDPEGGKIENNGMYTAPAQEGVYEIKASCISNPEIFAQAFAIVSQKKSETDEE